MLEKYVDLHIHTTISDGVLTPGEVAEYAHKEGLPAIAITDHDVTDGIEIAMEAASKYGLEVVAGVELSSEYNSKEVHILGYYMDCKNEEFQKKLALFRKARYERAKEMVERLKNLGMKIDFERVKEIAGKGSIGKPHIAQALVEKGYASNIPEGAWRHLGSGGPVSVPKYKLRPSEAIDIILKAGGIPVLAHPAGTKVDELIPQLVKNGLMGLETYDAINPPSVTRYYITLAKKYGLLVTGGSDCHGKVKGETRIGRLKAPYEIVERLKEAKRNLKR
ncbi:MAG TPA: PHP domain-containing protein [bacterium]|nr:PHP domain-containing protein [bacterium]